MNISGLPRPRKREIRNPVCGHDKLFPPARPGADFFAEFLIAGRHRSSANYIFSIIYTGNLSSISSGGCSAYDIWRGSAAEPKTVRRGRPLPWSVTYRPTIRVEISWFRDVMGTRKGVTGGLGLHGDDPGGGNEGGFSGNAGRHRQKMDGNIRAFPVQGYTRLSNRRTLRWRRITIT